MGLVGDLALDVAQLHKDIDGHVPLLSKVAQICRGFPSCRVGGRKLRDQPQRNGQAFPLLMRTQEKLRRVITWYLDLLDHSA
jgi:hypothetical protein